MLSTRKISRKIKTVKNLKKITRAMEMVSASKLRKVQGRLNTIQPYVRKMQAIITNLIPSLNTDTPRHPLLTPAVDKNSSTRPGTAALPVMVVVIASDKGLCGSYNNNIIRMALQFMHQSASSADRSQSPAIKIIALGRKVSDYFKKHSTDAMELVLSRNRLPIELAPKDLAPIISQITTSYLEKKVSGVWLVYADFVNVLIHKPVVLPLLPILPATITQKETTTNTQKTRLLPYGYIFEPEAATMLNTLLPKYLELLFYKQVLSAMASEQSARMMAMRNATGNADEVIDGLELTFNKARQSGITKELLEIISGVEAMKG
jgi:F-type H+-transporting ATPase subunit gamma